MEALATVRHHSPFLLLAISDITLCHAEQQASSSPPPQIEGVTQLCDAMTQLCDAMTQQSEVMLA